MVWDSVHHITVPLATFRAPTPFGDNKSSVFQWEKVHFQRSSNWAASVWLSVYSGTGITRWNTFYMCLYEMSPLHTSTVMKSERSHMRSDKVCPFSAYADVYSIYMSILFTTSNQFLENKIIRSWKKKLKMILFGLDCSEFYLLSYFISNR